MQIKIDGLAQTVQSELKAFKELTIAQVDAAVQETAKDTVALLKTTSPKRTGKYARSWRVQKEKQVATVYQGKYAYRAHLLEHGHASRNGGRVKAYPHIGPAEERAATVLVEKLRQKIGG